MEIIVDTETPMAMDRRVDTIRGAFIKGKEDESLKHHVNAIIDDDFWQVTSEKRTLKKRKEKVPKHLKRGANEKEMDSLTKRILKIPLDKPFEEAYLTHRLWMFFRETKETEQDRHKMFNQVMTDHLGLKIELSEDSFTFMDYSTKNSKGIIRNLEVQIGNSLVLVDFHVLDNKLNRNSSLLLGRAFMATIGAVCNMQTNQLCPTLITLEVYYHPVRIDRQQTSKTGFDTGFIAACYCMKLNTRQSMKHRSIARLNHRSTVQFSQRSINIPGNRSIVVMRMILLLCQNTTTRVLQLTPSLRYRLITITVTRSADMATILLAVWQTIVIMRALQWTLHYLRCDLTSITRTTTKRILLSTVVLPWTTKEFSIYHMHIRKKHRSTVTPSHRSTFITHQIPRDPEGQAQAMDGRILNISREDIAEIIAMNGSRNFLDMQNRAEDPPSIEETDTPSIDVHPEFRRIALHQNNKRKLCWESRDEYGV
ncbi:hypothetical protein F2Q68_00016234 [Brassica cretica]|uniref:Uncharacterized protein n=1 Tax=Brassica cretica TaxID=69181 RepID=A0A8S9HR75_BRACR|nr:hypothetical protein F2Q68_00016234 [Brassica cretica]